MMARAGIVNDHLARQVEARRVSQAEVNALSAVFSQMLDSACLQSCFVSGGRLYGGRARPIMPTDPSLSTSRIPCRCIPPSLANNNVFVFAILTSMRDLPKLRCSLYPICEMSSSKFVECARISGNVCLLLFFRVLKIVSLSARLSRGLHRASHPLPIRRPVPRELPAIVIS